MRCPSLFLLVLLLSSLWIFQACQSPDESKATNANYERPRLPDWHKNANIYEVNIRQYSPEGNFAGLEKQLDRLSKMGVDILWLMPIHPVSKVKRKGGLGSPYAVGDYKDVNPDFGNMDDFRRLLNRIHELGMYCILDWVPNHSGWDNPWISEHPDWYTKDSTGNITDPLNPNTGQSWGWTDVADFNYDNPDMRQGMIDAMKFWVEDVGIDGFRMDVAHSVPQSFWDTCTQQLYQIKPLFLLAEAESPELRNKGYFVMDYGWEMHHLLNDIARANGAVKGETKKLEQGNVVEGDQEEVRQVNALDIDQLLTHKDSLYQKGYAMHFTSNHDENAWAGTVFQRMGDAHLAFAVLTATFDGMPLIYGGMESAMDKQLAFFEKDTISWGEYSYERFYRTLFELKHRNQGLWNGEAGGPLTKIATGADDKVYAFMREKNGDQVIVAINLSGEKQNIRLQSDRINGEYTEVFNNFKLQMINGQEFQLEPWTYRVFSNK